MAPPDLTHHRFATRYLTLFGGETFTKVCLMVAFAYLARVLGPAQYGVLETVVTLTVFFVLGVESGMGSYGARHVAADAAVIGRLVPPVMALRAAFGLVAYAIVLTVAWSGRLPGLSLLAVNGLVVLLTPFFLQWVFQGLRQMQWVATSGAIRAALFVTAVLVFVRPGSSLLIVGAAEVAGASALAAYNVFVFTRRVGVRLDWTDIGPRTRTLVADVWPLGVSDVTWACLWYAPIVILGWMVTGAPEEVAFLAASVRIVYALHTFVWLYFFNLLPNLAHELARDLDGWRALVRRSMTTAMWPACLVAVGGTLIAPVLITLVYGAPYAAATRAFQTIVWLIPVMSFSGHYRFSLIAAGQQRWESAASVLTALTTVTATVLLVPAWGHRGAAAALLVGGVVNAVAAFIMTTTQVGRAPIGTLLAPVALAVALSLSAGGAVSYWAGAVAGATVATLAYVGIGLTQENELAAVARRLIARSR